MHQESLVKAVCARCGTDLVPAFRGRLRCPRGSACGYGGLREDEGALREFRCSRERETVRVQFTPFAVPSRVSA